MAERRSPRQRFTSCSLGSRWPRWLWLPSGKKSWGMGQKSPGIILGPASRESFCPAEDLVAGWPSAPSEHLPELGHPPASMSQLALHLCSMELAQAMGHSHVNKVRCQPQAWHYGTDSTRAEVVAALSCSDPEPACSLAGGEGGVQAVPRACVPTQGKTLPVLP